MDDDDDKDSSSSSSSLGSEARLDDMLDAALSEQVALEFSSALLYFGMAAWFSRPDVALGGVAKYFRNNYKEELE